jgi:hypothetical protein
MSSNNGQTPTGWVLTNCKLHDWQVAGGDHNCAGFFTLGLNGNHTLTNCTIYNTNSSVYLKNGDNYGCTFAYCYLENAGSSPQGVFANCGTNQAGTTTIHHCILVQTGDNSPVVSFQSDSTGSYVETNAVNFYSNTIYVTGFGQPQVGLFAQCTGTGSPTAALTHYNNLWACGNPGGGDSNGGTVMVGSAAGAVALSDYNGYVGSTSPVFTKGTSTIFAPSSSQTGLTNIRSGYGYETHSFATTTTSTCFASPGGTNNPTGYKLQSGSPAKNAGSTTGTTGGAACDLGAYGYDPATGLPNPTVGSSF